MFNPALGTFINLDPLESGSNLYAYCGDAPTDATHPSGFDRYLVTSGAHTFIVVDVWDKSGKRVVGHEYLQYDFSKIAAPMNLRSGS